jgi:lipopolysaccharide transport system ATP-binding protein
MLGGGRDAAATVQRARVALDDVSFTIEHGERVGIIGENGAGKSTLLRILSGVMAPSTGSVDISGRVHAVLTVGMGLRHDLTGRENLFVDGEIQGRTKLQIDAVIDEAIAFAELGEFIDRPVRTYSSGMKGRLSFAMLAFVEPEILLIDEALSVGDHWFSQKATRMVQQLCDRGRIVMIVSHGMGQNLKKIRQREEAEIAAKFGSTGDAWQESSAAAVIEVELLVGDDRMPSHVADSGRQLVVRCHLALERPLSAPDLRIWIERSDGTRITDNWLSSHTSSIPITGSTLAIDADFGTLHLRPFFYQVHAELWDLGHCIAHRTATLKVVATRGISGGEPAVRLPIEVVARQLAAP